MGDEGLEGEAKITTLEQALVLFNNVAGEITSAKDWTELAVNRLLAAIKLDELLIMLQILDLEIREELAEEILKRVHPSRLADFLEGLQHYIQAGNLPGPPEHNIAALEPMIDFCSRPDPDDLGDVLADTARPDTRVSGPPRLLITDEV